ncbi:MAG TPA: ribonuclease J [Thermopetrobacter sp.]|nr:ribonuclease J [Thermopetrobacter sp.]
MSGDLVLLPLGGVGEIGMNLYLYGFGRGARRQWIMVDCGVMFGDETTPGVELILPDISFIEQRKDDLLAIVITHAHEDHIGAVPWLAARLGAPVYATRFAAILLRHKLEELALDDVVEVRRAVPGEVIELGPFAVEYVPVTHSLPEPNALAITTAAGVVVHSGDFKVDETPTIPPSFSFHRLREIGDAGVEALICDSTNATRAGRTPSERVVAETLKRLIAAAPGRVAVTTFASHVARIKAVAEAARAAGREVVVAGWSMRRIIAAASECGLLDGSLRFLDEDAFGYLEPDKVALLCTGSQGEPRAALARIAADTHPRIALERGDTVIFSSFTIPGNEKAVISIINRLAMRGVEVITTAREAGVHASGHPMQEDLAVLYDLLRPARLIPMHGEPWHMMQQATFARQHGIAEVATIHDGRMLRIAPGPAEVVGEAPSGHWHVDGHLIVAGEGGPVKRRRKLSFVGLVALAVTLDGKGRVRAPLRIALEGVPELTADGQPMEEVLLDSADDALDGLSGAHRRDDDLVAERLRRAVRFAAKEHWGKRPVVRVLVQRL